MRLKKAHRQDMLNKDRIIKKLEKELAAANSMIVSILLTKPTYFPHRKQQNSILKSIT